MIRLCFTYQNPTGLFQMKRPPTSPKPARKPLSLLVLPEVREAVLKEAETDQRSISRTAEILLEEALEARKLKES